MNSSNFAGFETEEDENSFEDSSGDAFFESFLYFLVSLCSIFVFLSVFYVCVNTPSCGTKILFMFDLFI